MSGASFEIIEQLTILIKDKFNVPNTNENTPWYLETAIPYNTYTDGKNILIDEFDVNLGENWWTNTGITVESDDSSIYTQHGLKKTEDFSNDTDSGIYVSPDGKLQRFEKLRLDSITGADQNVIPSNSGSSYSYTKITTVTLAESFQF